MTVVGEFTVKPGALLSVAPLVEVIVTYTIGRFATVSFAVRVACAMRPTLESAVSVPGAVVALAAVTEPVPPGYVMIPVYEPVCGSVAACELELRVAPPVNKAVLVAGVDDVPPPPHALTASARTTHPANERRFKLLLLSRTVTDSTSPNKRGLTKA